MRSLVRVFMKVRTKRGFRRYASMAVSAYSSASWFSRVIVLALVFTSLTLIFQVFTDTASLVSRIHGQDDTQPLPLSPEQGALEPQEAADTGAGVVSREVTANDSVAVDPPQDFRLDLRMERGGEAEDIDGEETIKEQQEAEEREAAAEEEGGGPRADIPGVVAPPAPGAENNGGPGPIDAAKRLPDALIIGARKGGTRALITFLAMHPKLVTTGDEVQFFNNNESYAKGLGWYKEQMPPARSDQVLIEKTAEYFHVLWVPERVKQMDPNIKILLIVRDPFIRMVSDYNFLRRFAATNEVAGYDFPELKYSIEELAMDNKTGVVNRGYGGLHRSKYYKFLGNWLKHFPREQIHIINGDRLASENPALELTKVEQFLGIDGYFTEDFFYKDEEKGFYCITDTGCLGKEKGHKQPDFDPVFVTKVRNFLRPMNLLFYNMAGYDFNWE